MARSFLGYRPPAQQTAKIKAEASNYVVQVFRAGHL